MRYNVSRHALNVDVHWLCLTKAELLQAIAVAVTTHGSRHALPPTSATIELDDDGDINIEWHTAK
jgi:hypothetical protein